MRSRSHEPHDLPATDLRRLLPVDGLDAADQPEEAMNQSLPADLLDAVEKLQIENPADARVVAMTLRSPEHTSSISTTIAWLAALVARCGKRYDDNNPKHQGPHLWPLQA